MFGVLFGVWYVVFRVYRVLSVCSCGGGCALCLVRVVRCVLRVTRCVLRVAC